MNRLTARWVRKAEADVTGASELARAKLALNDLVCFRCQQAAEKYPSGGIPGDTRLIRVVFRFWTALRGFGDTTYDLLQPSKERLVPERSTRADFRCIALRLITRSHYGSFSRN